MSHIKIILKKFKSKYPNLFSWLLKLFTYLVNLFFLIIFRNIILRKGRNNHISYSKSVLNNVKIKINGKNNSINISTETIIKKVLILIKGDNHVLNIGSNNVIQNSELCFEDSNCEISIGGHCRIYGAHIAVTEPNSFIKIGSGCLFSSQIDIRNGDSHSIFNMENDERINYAKNIIIEDKVWIGKGATVLKGVTIGNNAVIGTRSLVTKDVPPNCISSGFPAKIIRENIYWKSDRIFK